jgi:type VI secretion system secreted protein VgrG
MENLKFNEPHFELQFTNVPEDKIRILSFEGKEEISGLYEYRFRLLSDDPEIDAKDILNNKATFVLYRGDKDPVKINGIISQFQQLGRTPDYVSYYAVLVPKMWRLTLNHQSVVFQNMKIEDIVTKVLKDAGFGSSDFEFKLDASYSKLEYVVQYRETDFDFINRRLEHFGIYYFIEQQGDDDVIVFCDSNDKLPAIESEEDIFYNPNKDQLSEKETISEILSHEKVVTGKVQLKDYNYEFPEKKLMVESQLDNTAPGTFYEYGDHFKDEKEGEFLAKIRNEEIICNSTRFKGIADCRLFRAGYKFKMDKHYRNDWNSEFIITSTYSRGNQRGLFGILPEEQKITQTYENDFEAIPIDLDYRPARKTPIPRIPGIMTAQIESASGDEYAYIDDKGRYHMKSPFDLGDSSKGEASRPIRLSQSYSGSGYGIHFPNHEDTEIIWSCVDGNVDRPLGLGTVPNASNASPSLNKNKVQNLIRTASGNEMLMDDTIDKTKISVTSADAHNLILDDEEDNIQVTTKEKNQITMDDKNQNITVKTTNGHMLTMDDSNTKITIQSKNGHFICIDDTDGSESMTIVDESGENTFVIDITNQKLVIKTENGDIDFHAPNGTIDMKATTFNLETSGDTTIKADVNIGLEAGGDYEVKSAGNITEEASGDYSSKGTNVTTEADMDYNVKGLNVTVKGDMDAKVEGGMNFEGKGGMMATLDGGMTTDVKGGAKTAITGGVVMIN